MEQKPIRLLIAGVIIVGLFGVFLGLAIKIYEQNESVQLQKDSLTQWKEQSLHEYLRKVEQRLQKLEWDQMLMKNDMAALKSNQAQPSTMPSRFPGPADNGVDDSGQVRHYFQHCKGDNFSKIIKGMSKSDIRALCGGHEFPAFETVRHGFCFALNDARSSFYTFNGWMPKMSVNYDFFVSDTDLLLYVRYDHQGLAEVIEQFPVTKDQQLSGQQAGVEIKQTNGRTLEMTISPSS